MNLDQMTSRLRRAITPPATAPASAPNPEPTSRAAVEGPLAPRSPTPGGGGHPAPPPGSSPSSSRRPKRRRWLPPTSPAERHAEPVDQPPVLYPCPHCGEAHQPFPMSSSRGLAAFGESLLSDLGRPEPLNRTADDTPLQLLRFRPWNP